MSTELEEPRLAQLERAIAVLRVFDPERPRLTVSEVAQLTDSMAAVALGIAYAQYLKRRSLERYLLLGRTVLEETKAR